jgi:hypothetical protein
MITQLAALKINLFRNFKIKLKVYFMEVKKKIINILLTKTKNSKNIIFFFSLYIFGIIIANYIYCYLFINKFPEIVSDNNIYVLKNLGFNFGQIMQNLNQNGEFKANYFNVDFYVSRMPALPLILNFLYVNITKNFFIIHLIKNIFFLSLIFFLLKNIFNKYKLIYFLSGLAVLFYNPHNLWTSLSFNFEEGILNYLIVIILHSLARLAIAGGNWLAHNHYQ